MDKEFMGIAIAEAQKALAHADVPVGAVVIHQGAVVGAGHNERERLLGLGDRDPHEFLIHPRHCLRDE